MALNPHKKGYGFTHDSAQRIVDTVLAHERKGRPDGIVPEPPPRADLPEPVWFRLRENLLPNSTAALATLLRWSPAVAMFVEDYDQGANVSVIDRWEKWWGLEGEIGAAVPTANGYVGSDIYENQVTICPGKNIYLGNMKAGEGNWGAGATIPCETLIDGITREVDVTDPGYIQGAGTGLEIPDGSTVRFYCNIEAQRFELLDSPACPQ